MNQKIKRKTGRKVAWFPEYSDGPAPKSLQYLQRRKALTPNVTR